MSDCDFIYEIKATKIIREKWIYNIGFVSAKKYAPDFESKSPKKNIYTGI